MRRQNKEEENNSIAISPSSSSSFLLSLPSKCSSYLSLIPANFPSLLPSPHEALPDTPTNCPVELRRYGAVLLIAKSYDFGSPSSLNPFAFNIQHGESNAPYFSWPTLSRLNNAVEDRANYFANLQKGVLPEIVGRLPSGQQATTLLELMTIRAFHSKILRRFSLGTAVGFRITRGVLTKTPAILVFVARKVHRQWLNPMQCLPSALEGPGGVWCDVDVVEFQYYGAPAATPKEQVYNELVDGLRGSDPCIGSGSQVASQETYGTLGAIVKSRTGNHQVGFLTNRHVAVDLDYPSQKMFHPLPPSLGPGVYLGAVERATSFITDDQWYGIFADTNPETFVRADGAFIPFAEDLSMRNVTTVIKGIGEIGNVHVIDLQSPIDTLIGKQVVKVGRSSGYTTGTVMAYALEYNDEKGICFLTDFLVIGENQQTFDLEGDSGSLILLTSPNGQKPRPVGIIWGGTANRGRLKLIAGQEPENWTSGVDLGRLLDLLELNLITSNHELEAAREQRNTSVTAIGSTVCQSSPPDPVASGDKQDESFEPFIPPEFRIEEAIKPTPEVEEHVFIAPLSFNESTSTSRGQEKLKVDDLVALKSSSEEEDEVSISLHLGEPKLKKSKFS
ncbi:BnaA05g08780D [Brassica napus]|uniref:BnaA05g08780D protein n=1 Tax=Brassica napus TaxID=3708 RepID=A0A078H2N0_BRANA|nr:BnaA05g08780D [Brassica napus]